ncbi:MULTISPECIES: ACP S-malonyltransferase [unclassified Undibacterium]|uniref:ACP S-malonyltransferase n=1 Tax=unclassified Undibacterium TaxID=2630295 RepID=UPI002AC8C128|nr:MULTISPECIES: ACP S-malonyltransferase [unclassified Undibacterium]MEB0138379.1 ACP S-malonyltransferase [Undibacterium sp. CCC2.1]MEB0171254.1 ACP S-malonyltransferase [Undibacterium sp. CCC1.1]MEB0176624.1 ACP S-malonyltransferase [Undibacterium sp. CCC3.4]MEB0214007.1 ACP S-malonyltransferase [Undibacterium sp. 5I2]WPX43623.1 ACP S-malonyltransferase [Undibacterium sp. CCC3.4]
MITFMFPGQGAQHKGMGREVFDLFPNEMKQAKAILGYELKDLCEQAGPRLNDTAYTQPALYTVNALMQMDIARRSGVRPDYVIGHSLGEYNALLSAGVFDFQTGLDLVKKRGELMARENGKGSMIAVLDPDRAVLEAIAAELGDDFCIANDNAPSQLVCAGSMAAVDAASKKIAALNAGKVIPLKVSGAFHTRFMADAAEQFLQYCRQCSFKPPQLPVISNQSARPHGDTGWAEKLAKHLTSPVQWRQSLSYLAQRGPMLFQEVGPGTLLTGLAKNNLHTN